MFCLYRRQSIAMRHARCGVFMKDDGLQELSRTGFKSLTCFVAADNAATKPIPTDTLVAIQQASDCPCWEIRVPTVSQVPTKLHFPF